MDHDISDRTMLVGLKISAWSGEKRDNTITAEICKAKSAQAKAVRANKSLLGERIKPVKAAEGALRGYVNDRTLPWMDNGLRILKTTVVRDFQLGLAAPMDAFERAVETFIENYGHAKAEARHALGDAYRESDFPAGYSLRGRFSAKVVYMPMPRSDDFRMALTEDEMAAVRRNCTSALQGSVRDAVMAAVTRLREPIQHMAERLRSYRRDEEGKAHNIFRDSLVTNIEDIIELAPSLNITDDPRITRICEEMRMHLVQHDADTLRQSPQLRMTVATQANRIIDQLNGAFA